MLPLSNIFLKYYVRKSHTKRRVTTLGVPLELPSVAIAPLLRRFLPHKVHEAETRQQPTACGSSPAGINHWGIHALRRAFRFAGAAACFEMKESISAERNLKRQPSLTTGSAGVRRPA